MPGRRLVGAGAQARAGTLLALCEGRRASRQDMGDIALLARRSYEANPQFPLMYAPPEGIGPAQAQYILTESIDREAYVATGEPLQVAGAFTVDSLGGPFIERVDGDPSTVVGMSLSTVRRLCNALGIAWTDLWRSAPSRSGSAPDDGASS